MFAYKLRDTKANSEKLGACDVCHKEVSRVYMLTKYKKYFSVLRNADGLSYFGDNFGHKKCLSDLTNV